jgi:hypothetical protein
MWKRSLCGALLAVFAPTFFAQPFFAQLARAGGPIDALELQSSSASSDPNVMLVPLVPGRFDSRCIPMPFSLNTSRDPLPNPLGAPTLSLREARRAIEDAMKTWAAVPTSFVQMELSGTTASRRAPRQDFVNEISFLENTGLPPGAIAATIPRTLQTRTEFRAGQDLDGDRDPDVAAGITQCADVDRDGDIEFPPGIYEAGTIFEADLIFNTAAIRFTVANRDVDTQQRSADLRAIATHELGHAQGLAHSVINQRGDRDGRGSTMFPSVGLTDPADELASRSLDADSIAATTQLYPEGSATSGPAALQGGDVAVSARFGEVVGSVRTPEGNPIVGANVFCRDPATGAITGSTYSGQARARLDRSRQRLMPMRTESVLNGDFRLVLPAGTHECGIEAVDGAPVRLSGANVVTEAAQIGELLGQTAFPEELFDGQQESSLETSPGTAERLRLVAGGRLVLDFTTNVSMAVDAFDTRREPVQFLAAAPDTIFAVVVPGSTLMAMDQAAKTALGPAAVLAIQRAEFRTRAALPSAVPVFASASLNRCSRMVMNPPDGPATLQVDIANPLRSRTDFVAQDSDFSPLFLDDSVSLGREVIEGIGSGAFSDVCLLLRLPAGAGPRMASAAMAMPAMRGPAVGIDARTVALKGLSFASQDGGQSFRPTMNNLQFSLGITPLTR